jgi:hypothetical protein
MFRHLIETAVETVCRTLIVDRSNPAYSSYYPHLGHGASHIYLSDLLAELSTSMASQACRVPLFIVVDRSPWLRLFRLPNSSRSQYTLGLFMSALLQYHESQK